MTLEKKWYAVYTRPRCERKVHEQLLKNGIDSYCPLNKIQRQWSDRKKIVFEPLFKSYVFVRLHLTHSIQVRQTQGVINFVYWLNKPAIIHDEEIMSIKNFLNKNENVRLEKIDVKPNDRIKILTGPLMEHTGIVTSVQNKSVRIVLSSLGYSLFVDVKTTNIENLTNFSIPAKQNIINREIPSGTNGRLITLQ